MEKKTSEKITWTTWEELLLSCAVKRHGVNDWNAVSTEIQSRTTSLPHVFTTPRHCKLKYLDLKRRFKLTDDMSTIAAVKSGDDGGGEDVPWIDELKDLRLAELRREVLNYDSSILSLQLKVKRLEEERERSVKSNDEKPDLEKFTEEHGSENAKRDYERENNSPEIIAVKSVSGEKSDSEYQSANESNSTDPKREIQHTGDTVFEPAKSGSEKLNPVQSLSSPVCDESCNASSDSIAKDLTKKTEWDSSVLRDSVSESKKSVEENTKDSNNDEQSSASLTKSSRRKYETESAAIKNCLVKSQPLIGIMELIRSHNYGSLFESRRLEIQESDNYNNIVRQHMDLLTVQKKLQQGSYSSSPSKFYRDLLLIFNNAIVFFSKSSVESAAAIQLRNLVVNEMSKQTQQSSHSSPEALLSTPFLHISKPEPERPEEPLIVHQKLSAPIIVCRMRSSISSKAASAAVVYSRKNELKSVEKKPTVDAKLSLLAQGKGLMKSDTKDSIATGTRRFNRSNATNLKNKGADKKETTEKKDNKKETEKKSGAADFLKRIKENSPLDAKSKRKFVEKKDGRMNGIVLRPKQVTKEEINPSKRSGGSQPLKKNADLVPVKRRREGGEASTSKRPKKRPRR